MNESVAHKRVGVTPADCMRRKREALYAEGNVQCKMHIPLSFGEHLKELKARYRMRGMDQVISAMIRKAMANFTPEELTAPPPPSDHMTRKKIAVHIPREHYEFLEAVALRNRGITLGVALETVGANVSDLSPAPLQLSLIEEGGSAVSG